MRPRPRLRLDLVAVAVAVPLFIQLRERKGSATRPRLRLDLVAVAVAVPPLDSIKGKKGKCDWTATVTGTGRPQSRLVAVAVTVALPFLSNALIKGKTQENHYSAYTANGARTARETTKPSRAQKRLQQTTGTWCSGITPAQHAGGPGFNPQCVHMWQPRSTVPTRGACKTTAAGAVTPSAVDCARSRARAPK